MNLVWIDWAIVLGFLLFLWWMLFFSRRYVRNTADFLVAGRCGGRYMLSIARGAVALGSVALVAGFERDYVSGFTSTWWYFLQTPLVLFLGVFGWVYYRYRETRVLTLAQFFELRYNRPFRIFCGVIAWVSGIINYGIFPAVSARFLICFCGLPEHFRLLGLTVETYAFVLFLVVGTGVCFAIIGGQVSIMITDFVQGMFLNITVLIIMVYLYYAFDLNDIAQTLLQHGLENPESSMLNPFKTAKTKNFNIYFYLIGIFAMIYSTNAWQGSSGYNAAARTPHEAKMATIISSWRTLVQSVLFLFIPICCFAVLRNPKFADIAQAGRTAIASIENGQLQQQLTVAMVFVKLLPAGIIGLFVAVFIAAMISTDNTYMHSWGSIFVQDVVMPLWEKPLSVKAHLYLLRASIVLVGVFAWLFSYYFRQNQHIYMFFAMTGTIYLGGAGSVIIGGLYTRKGSVWGAWGAMVSGVVIGIGGLFMHHIKPGWACGADGELFFNSQEVYFFAILIAVTLYISGSFLERLILRTPDYDLEKLLHRGKYAVASDHEKAPRPQNGIGWFDRVLGVNKDFTFWDKIILYTKTLWVYFWFGCFIVLGLTEAFFGISDLNWWKFWKFKLEITFFIGIGVTFWFVWGGISDLKHMLGMLKNMTRDDGDNGEVVKK